MSDDCGYFGLSVTQEIGDCFATLAKTELGGIFSESSRNPRQRRGRNAISELLALQREGGICIEPFSPYPDKPAMLSYYEIPPDVLENPPELSVWAEESLLIQKKKK